MHVTNRLSINSLSGYYKKNYRRRHHHYHYHLHHRHHHHHLQIRHHRRSVPTNTIPILLISDHVFAVFIINCNIILALDLNVGNKLVKCYIWSIAFHSAETWTDRRVDQKYEGWNLIVATIYLQLIQNRYMFRSFTVLQCCHQHCVQPVASDVEVVGYL